jgi:SHOCT-like domain
MSDETRRILDLLAQGKITVDEADKLLHAVGAAPPAEGDAPTPEAGAKRKPRVLRIVVHKRATEWRPDKDVTIRVPIALVRGGMKLGALIPGFAGKQMEARLREQGLDVDLSRIDASAIEAMLSEAGEAMDIDIDSGKAQVRISCE